MTGVRKGDPKLPIRPHVFVPDASEPADWWGEYRCHGCRLPRRSRVHDYTPPADDRSAQIIGESEE